MRIAIIGAGIAGNVVARGLYRHHEIAVYEAGDHVGGHSHTHQVEVGGRQIAVDTGFIVYNDSTYPRFSRCWRNSASTAPISAAPTGATASMRAASSAPLLRFPLMTLQVVAAIHWQALRLWLQRVPYIPHPIC